MILDVVAPSPLSGDNTDLWITLGIMAFILILAFIIYINVKSKKKG